VIKNGLGTGGFLSRGKEKSAGAVVRAGGHAKGIAGSFPGRGGWVFEMEDDKGLNNESIEEEKRSGKGKKRDKSSTPFGKKKSLIKQIPIGRNAQERLHNSFYRVEKEVSSYPPIPIVGGRPD